MAADCHAVLNLRPFQDEMEWLNQQAPCVAAGGACWSQDPDQAGSAEELGVAPNVKH